MTNSNYQVIILAAGMAKRFAELGNKPKSFLTIKGKKIIYYHLDILNEQGIKNVTIVVGYLKDLLIKTIGTKYKNLLINYVISKDYATTNHSWSLFLTKEKWMKDKKPIILIHADVFFDPKILDKVLASKHKNVISVDNLFKVQTGDECVIKGKNGLISSIKISNVEFDKKKDNFPIVGELIGINKWSVKFMKGFYEYLQQFFKKHGKNYNYERI